MCAVRILITGTNTTLDTGESAMASMAVKSLKLVFPNAHFVVGSTQKNIDSERWRRMLPYGKCGYYSCWGNPFYQDPADYACPTGHF